MSTPTIKLSPRLTSEQYLDEKLFLCFSARSFRTRSMLSNVYFVDLQSADARPLALDRRRPPRRFGPAWRDVHTPHFELKLEGRCARARRIHLCLASANEADNVARSGRERARIGWNRPHLRRRHSRRSGHAPSW